MIVCSLRGGKVWVLKYFVFGDDFLPHRILISNISTAIELSSSVTEVLINLTNSALERSYTLLL